MTYLNKRTSVIEQRISFINLHFLCITFTDASKLTKGRNEIEITFYTRPSLKTPEKWSLPHSRLRHTVHSNLEKIQVKTFESVSHYSESFILLNRTFLFYCQTATDYSVFFCFLVINEVSLNLIWTSQWFLTTVTLIIEEVSKGVLHPQRITRTTSGDRVTLTMTRTEQQTHCTDMPQWMTVGVKVSVDQFEKEFTGGNVLLCATHWLCLLWGLWRADNLFSPS